MKATRMILILHLLLLFIFIVYLPVFICQGQKKKLTPEQKTARNKILMKTMTYNQVGLFNRLPNGPLPPNEVNAYFDDKQRKKQSGTGNKCGVVYISDALQKKKLGKFRITSSGLDLIFPTDSERAKYQDSRENEVFKDKVDLAKLKAETKILMNAETDLTRNPFEEILDTEKNLVDFNLNSIDKGYEYKKNLMQLAVEKEQDIFNKMYHNELSEIQTKRYNKGFINPMYKTNLPGSANEKKNE